MFGWLIWPFVEDGPVWYLYEKNFSQCSKYVWSVLAMTINFIPRYEIANDGCFYWGWFVPCLLQLSLFSPALVFLIWKVSSKAGRYLVVTLIILVGIAINFTIVYINDFSTGIFAPADLHIFRLFVVKPYTKIHAMGLGILLAMIYRAFISYKQYDEHGAVMKVLDRNRLLTLAIYILAFTIMGVICLIPTQVSSDPTLWTLMENCFYISFSRPALLLCIIAIVTQMWLNNGHRMKRFLATKTFTFLSKLGYPVYLLFPIANTIVGSTRGRSLYLSIANILYLFAFNVAFTFMMAFVFYLFIQKPIDNLIFGNKIKYKKTKKQKYLRPKTMSPRYR
mmetsp:Transcript_35026/g.34035  ORF Transcript_35026/g.34035 Transcript_35026/m.34035 type:complete len:336 (+) Transcript_35026:1133-2140(+)